VTLAKNIKNALVELLVELLVPLNILGTLIMMSVLAIAAILVAGDIITRGGGVLPYDVEGIVTTGFMIGVIYTIYELWEYIASSRVHPLEVLAYNGFVLYVGYKLLDYRGICVSAAAIVVSMVRNMVFEELGIFEPPNRSSGGTRHE